MNTIANDLRLGLRRLLHQPAFTAVAVLTLGLGIGANTAIFSVINAVLLRRLPVEQPDRLVVFSDSPSQGTQSGDPVIGKWDYFSYASYLRFRDQTPAFAGLAASRSGTSELSVMGESGTSDGPAQLATGQLVSGNYFEVMGARPQLGRTLVSLDDSAAAAPVAVLSHRYWRERLGADAAVLGRSLIVNGTAVAVVGVMPARFFGERVRQAPDFWLPLHLQPQIELRGDYAADPTIYYLNLIGRLQPRASLADAEAQANQALRQYLADLAGGNPSDTRQEEIGRTRVDLASATHGVSSLRYRYSGSLYILMGVVLMVLLIACGNIANLLLARAAGRQSEIAVRLAMGASRSRLIQQLVSEGMLLALAGGVAGLLLAQWGVEGLVRLVSTTAPIEAGVSPPVLGFTLLVSLAAGLLFSLVPAIHASRQDLRGALNARAQSGGSRGRPGLATFLVASQVALSLALLLGAGLLARSLTRMEQQDLGLDTEGVLLAKVEPRLAGYRPASLAPYYRQLVDRAEAVPGVQAATIATYSPLGSHTRTESAEIPGRDPEPGTNQDTGYLLVGPGFLETLGLTLKGGRAIDERDQAGTGLVAMVNEAFARDFFGTSDPLGAEIRMADTTYRVVGVVADARFRRVDQPAERMVYTAIYQEERDPAFGSVLQVRVAGDPAAFGRQLRAAIAEVDSRVPIVDLTTLQTQVHGTLAQPRLLATLVAFFGGLAAALAAVGLYGVVAQSVARRTGELGIRMALGADRGLILRLILGETTRLVLAGIVIGLPLSLAASRLIRSQLYGIGAGDPGTLIAAVGFLVSVGLIAGLIPAIRATAVDPMTALRDQ